ncbi:enoyl-CoA hydratase/isomerase family protein [Pseudoduganella namucuonensis]|uniref:Enoyl-CoA hydratase n=1 Tax=Pseudoduganella namucuonensis TaxID=1035707 RepID=A0A1I7LZS9_9BURK|nr:enoyl-CoA hydratase-related protein [Pseudoduganella namucuonensis]SFV15214.1 Enoyl-CoA hydratase [Pseudoduganella namucuonensis]
MDNNTNSPILYSNHGGIARIRFNRPAALNSIDEEMAKSLCRISFELANSQDVRVVVVSGEGAAFMAGGDLASFHQDKARAVCTADAIIKPLNVALTRLAALPQPIIASVHGAVAGAGVSIALACDLCIAADDTQFNLAYARIGASPDAGGSWSLPRVVGTRKALELVLLAESFGAEEARRLGLVNRVVARHGLEDATETLARRLAAGPSYAYGRIKRLIHASFDTRFEDQLDAERKAFCACAGTADFAEGLDAFFEKRRPVFSGA